MISSLELARICGVSQGTVDRALHGRGGISPKTRERVLGAARRHGYIPNPAARELMTGESRTVAMLLPRLDRFFMMDLAEAIKKSLGEQGLRLVISIAPDKVEADDALMEFASRRVRSAVVIPPTADYKFPEGLFKQNSVISLLAPCANKGTVFIHPEERLLGNLAAEYLHSEGHRRALHLTYRRDTWAINERAAGFRSKALELGLETDTISFKDAESFHKALRQSGASAVFCHNDWLAFQALTTLESKGCQIPGKIRIIGVDNSPSFNELCSRITTFEYPFGWTAEQVASTAKNGIPPPTPCPKPQLILRST